MAFSFLSQAFGGYSFKHSKFAYQATVIIDAFSIFGELICDDFPSGDRNIHTSPFILTHYLKTLSLILHAAGTSPLSLPQMTSEFWDLLLSLRSRASDVPVLEALLFSFLTLLELNSNNQRRLAEEHAKELLETREWVQMVFEKVGGGSEEGERVRMLAAGVLTKTREVVEKYQRLLLGDLIDFM